MVFNVPPLEDVRFDTVLLLNCWANALEKETIPMMEPDTLPSAVILLATVVLPTVLPVTVKLWLATVPCTEMQRMLPGVAGAPVTVRPMPPMLLLVIVALLVGDVPPRMIPLKIKAEPPALIWISLLADKLPTVLLSMV